MFGAIYFYAPLKNTVIKEEVVERRSVKDAGSSKEISAQQIYENFNPAVVNVSSVRGTANIFGFGGGNEEATGSGFIISKDGLVVTNDHVVEDADAVKVTLFDKTEFNAKVLGTDRSTDLAVLKIEGFDKKITPLRLSDSSDLKVGDTVYAIGNPLGLEGSMSRGIVSNTNRTIDAPNGFQIRNVIQTDAAINRGNSGGPLINTFGRVIGVSAQIATEGGSGNIGIAFAIPSSTVKNIVEQISDKGGVSHAWLGISGRDVTKGFAEEFKLPVSKGALVVDIFNDSPASKAGLKGVSNKGNDGDIIVQFGEDKVDSMEDLIVSLEGHNVGEEVDITFYRDNDKKIAKVKLEERPQKDLQ